MVLVQWIERLGQIIAPDENYTPKPDILDTQSPFWNYVAPDPNFQSPPASDVPKKSTRFKTPPNSSSFLLCENCEAKLCAGCRAKVAGLKFSETPSSASTSKTSAIVLKTPSVMKTPRRQEARSDTAVQRRATEAIISLADTKDAAPTGANKLGNKVIQWACSPRPLTDVQKERLSKTIKKRPELLRARSYNMGQACPDGFTPFQAAAYKNRDDAMQLIYDQAKVNEQTDFPIGTTEVLQDTDPFGSTAFHVATKQGNVEAAQFVKEKTDEKKWPVPRDLQGKTPLGACLTSPEPKASLNKGSLKKLLFDVDDPSLRGDSLPVQDRLLFGNDSLCAFGGISELPGERVRTEDYILADSSLGNVLLIAVVDGHSDRGLVAEMVAKCLVSGLKERLRTGVPTEASAWDSSCKAVCSEADQAVKDSGFMGGAVALVVAVTETRVVCLNVGDCRCILVQKKDGGSSSDDSATYQVVPLSSDHKPNDPEELHRIEGAGLSVVDESFEENGRQVPLFKVVCGKNKLAATRAFGDFEYKANTTLGPDEQAVITVPQVTVRPRSPEDLFLIAACDGIWDVMENEQVAAFVGERLETLETAEATILPEVCDELLVECLKRQARDNLSVSIVALTQPTSEPSPRKQLFASV